MNEQQVPALRNELLSILDAVHHACVENNIQYYIVAGTALGAVRHHGFIPWDVDIDIAFPRQDYERFISNSKEILNPLFRCGYYGNSTPWNHMHALVFKQNTKICWNKEYYKNKQDCPIYIDLFALDHVPDSIMERDRFEKRVKRMVYFMGRKECVIYQHNNAVQETIKRLYKGFFDTVYPKNTYNKLFEKTITKYNSEQTEKIGILTSPYSFSRECIDYSIIGTPKLYPFEGREYYGYENMDAYLSHLYGNYMELPPEEERKYHLELIDHIVCE